MNVAGAAMTHRIKVALLLDLFATFARKRTTSPRNVYSREIRRKRLVLMPLMKKRMKPMTEAAIMMRAATHIWCMRCIR